jgi:RNA polymerase sigma-70 factor (ECF subfamily)
MFGSKYGAGLEEVFYPINGEPGILTFYEGRIFSATTFEFEDGKIAAVYRVMNPDKLKNFENLDEKSQPS